MYKNRSCIPETLNKVLEPVSVLHLDMAEDFPDTCPIYNRPLSGKRFIRHGSMGCEDPGVIGPVVWELHAKRLQNGLIFFFFVKYSVLFSTQLLF